jgi:signal transduction histidine kinase
MDFITRIKSFANDLLEETNINFKVKNNIPDAEKIQLPMDLRRNLIRIFKESLHNAFKYAKCDKIKFELTWEAKELILILNDDGIGFDIDKESTGNGLVNMKNRAQKINGNLQISSQPQKGTQIKILVKI